MLALPRAGGAGGGGAGGRARGWLTGPPERIEGVETFESVAGSFAARMQAWEEERLEKKREYEDMVSLVRLGDPAMHAKVKKEVESAFQREPDFGR